MTAAPADGPESSASAPIPDPDDRAEGASWWRAPGPDRWAAGGWCRFWRLGRRRGPTDRAGALLVGILVIAGIVGLQILDDSGANSEKLGAVDATTATSVDPTATSGVTRPPNEVRVKVYNASGVDQQAQVMSNELKAQNWAVQEAATLKSVRTGTAVQCVAGFENEALALATSVGRGAVVEAYPATPPDGATGADCLVILGKT